MKPSRSITAAQQAALLAFATGAMGYSALALEFVPSASASVQACCYDHQQCVAQTGDWRAYCDFWAFCEPQGSQGQCTIGW